MSMRCNYCEKTSTVRFRYRSRMSTRPRNPWVTVTVQSCSEHEGCVNWRSNRKRHLDEPLERFSEGLGQWRQET